MTASPGYTALDILGSARYWSQDVDLSLRFDGKLTADIEADFKRLGLKLKRKVSDSRSVVVAHANDLEWVDPVVGARMRHVFASGSEFDLLGDVGGFGAGSEFSWQAVATYGFDVNAFGTTMRSVVGYRALYVDYNEIGAAWQGWFGLGAARSRPRRSVSLVAPRAREPTMVRQRGQAREG